MSAALVSGCGGSSPEGSGGTSNPSTPAITSITPSRVPSGSSAVTLTVSGSGFLSSSVVQVGGLAEGTTYVTATQLTASVPSSQMLSGAELAVVVLNGSVSSGSGAAVNLEVDNPSPVITSAAPTSEATGAASAVVMLTGTGFVPTTVIQVNGSARTTTYTSSTQVSVALSAADVATAGTLSLTAVNPAPGGGTSTAASLAVIAPNAMPVIAALSPATEVVGATSPVVTVTGTGFAASTVIDVNGGARPTTFISAGQVSVTLTPADVSAVGNLSLTAVNPVPGGGSSAAVTLAVDNPPVGTIQLSPSSLPTGDLGSATVTVSGSTFVPSSVIEVNGVARPTSYVNATALTFIATVADQASAGTLAVTVTNPPPGGGTSPAASLTIGTPATPVLTSVSPNSIVRGSSDTTIEVLGNGFTSGSFIQWNGTPLATTSGYYSYGSSTELMATVPGAELTTTGTASVTVDTPGAAPAVSNAEIVTITDPPAPTLTSMYPSAGPLDTSTAVTLEGTGFTASSTVGVNGATVSSTFVDSTQITVTLPALTVATPGNLNITVTTAAPGGGTTAPLTYTTYLAIPNNDIVYNAVDGLLYASVPVSYGGIAGNSVAGIDPATGAVTRQIWVGSNPDKLALSTDGTQLFVGLDGAGAVAQVDLTQGKVVNQFSLGGGAGIYDPPSTAGYLAAVPGSPNSVAVAVSGGFTSGTGVTIFDSGVARAKTSVSLSAGYGPLSFGASSSTLYMAGPNIEEMTVDSTGITGATQISSSSYTASWIQYDNGRLYVSTGAVLDASSGNLLGTFYSTSTTPASGPIVSDSALGKAFIAENSYTSSGAVLAFDESTFNSAGSIAVNGVGMNGYPTSFAKIVRWGQNGIAMSATAGAFSTVNQIFIFQSPLVKDLSSSPADVSVTLTAPATTTTGTAVSWVATVENAGPNAALGTTLALSLDSSLIVNSVTASQGSCGTGVIISCDLGGLADGASATVTVSATATDAGTLTGTAFGNSSSFDPSLTNNEASASTTVTGSAYGAVPVVSAISPNLVQAGSGDFTLTVTGTGFNSDSTVNLNTTALPTTLVSATTLTATVTAAQIANYGWQAITVSNPLPGGGVSQIVPLTIYDVVNVPASGLLFDPYSQLLYATVPGTATNMTGNSIVSIDPATGTVGTPVSIGSEPTVMTETTDGDYLYAGLSGSDSLAQFNLLTQSLTATIPLSVTQSGTTSSVAATWLAAMPGSDTTLAVDATNGWGTFGIFDVSGNAGSFRPNFSGIYAGVDPVFADANDVYAYDSQTSGAEFYRYSVNANGLVEIDGTTLNGMGGFGGNFQLLNGLVYGAGGGIANPGTTPPSQVATLPTVDFYEPGISTYAISVAADPSLQKEFLVEENEAGSLGYAVVRYDLNTYLPESVLTMPSSINNVEPGWAMLRWGQDGLALLATSENYATNQPITEILLLRGPFVTPQLLESGTAATLTSSSATTITHGGGNTVLTLTGTNLLPGVAVTWNGSYHTTTVVDANHVNVMIPAADLASTGTVTVVATNPGALPSSPLQITID